MNKNPVLNLAILCDEVTIENGKYHFKGLFEQIQGSGFPAVHKSAFIVTRWGNGLGKDFIQRILIKAEDNDEIIFDSTTLEKPFSLSASKSTHTIVGNMLGLTFKRECDCKIEIYLNGVKQDAELYFKVVKIKNPIGGRISQYFMEKT